MKKICTKCKEEKELSFFHRKSATANYYMSKCKECHAIMSKRYYQRNKEKIAEQKKLYQQKNKEKIAETRKQYKKKYPKIRNAHRRVEYAIKTGKLIRPSICSICGKRDSKIEAHYNNYDNPLDICWVCTSCSHNFTKIVQKVSKS